MSDDAGSELERTGDRTPLGGGNTNDLDSAAPPWVFQQVVELELKRIEVNNRRVDVALKAIAASDASDKRQYEYYSERLRQGSKDRNERHRSIVKLAWSAMGVTAAAAGLVASMLFFGDDAQRAVASDLLGTIGTAVGGGGALWAINTAVQRFLASKHRDD